MMNKETQPKRNARSKKIQQPSLSTDKTVSLPLTSQPGSAEEAEGGQEKRKKITKAAVGDKSRGSLKTVPAKSGGRTKKAPKIRKKVGKPAPASSKQHEQELKTRKEEPEGDDKEEGTEGSRIGGQDDQRGEVPLSADEVWPVLINGQTVWVQLDTKPSPEVRPADHIINI